MLRAVLVAQGSEITTGEIADTNSAWLAERLDALGIAVRRVLVAPDDLDEIAATLREAAALGDVVVGTGGLGPTRDDLTSEAAARAFGLPREERADALALVEAALARRGRALDPAQRRQAVLPAGARALPNPEGIAPGIALEAGGARLYLLPGVPREMRAMFRAHVEPELSAMPGADPAVRRVLRVFGLPESELELRLRGLDLPELADGRLRIGFRTALPENLVKLDFRGVDAERREAVVRAVLERLGRHAYGVDTGDLAAVVQERLVRRGETLALAESCTAGRLAAWVGSVPGASRVLLEGAVVYSNAAKVRTCGVDPADIERHGAVSEPVARALAEGIRRRAGATWGIGITGIAGPTGGTPDKPVGTVHIAVAGPGGTAHRRRRFRGTRDQVTTLSAAAALWMLLRALDEPGPTGR